MHPMLDFAVNKVIRLTITTAPGQLEGLLASLSPGMRLALSRDLDRAGVAHRFDESRHCAYYLRRQNSRVMVWRWSYVASKSEALRMQAQIEALEGRLDVYRANRIFEQATQRSIARPRPRGMPFHALDFGPYPALHA